MSTQQPQSKPARRRFLAGAAAAATGAATLGFPAIVKAQGPISMRWQSTWPSKDIFHEYANDFAKKVNDMTGGDLRIEVLPAGAVVPAITSGVAGSPGCHPASSSPAICSRTTRSNGMSRFTARITQSR